MIDVIYILIIVILCLGIVTLLLRISDYRGAGASYSTAIEGLANDYDSIVLVNLSNNTSKNIRVTLDVDPDVAGCVATNYFDAINIFIGKLVSEESREYVSSMFDKSNIVERLNEERFFSFVYTIDSEDGTSHYYETKIMRYGNWPRSKKVVVAGRCIDQRMIEEEAVRVRLEDSVSARTAELKEKNDRLNRINDDIISFLGDIVEARDVESGEHVRRVRGFTYILCKQLMEDYPEYGLNNVDVELITSASALHDLGKIMIPDAILLKPARLTPEEFEIMKTHSEKGVEILKHAPKDWSEEYLKTSMDIVRYHHEKYDGKGYPNGLKGEDIPISAQIVSIVDCYDALINKRCYKDAYSFDDAFNMIVNGECGAFSDKIISCFKKCKDSFEHHALDKESEYGAYDNGNTAAGSLEGVKILLAEDDDLTREICADALTAGGAIVTEAGSGEELLEIFKNAPKGAFDLVMTDIFMQGIDGFETTRRLRNSRTPGCDTIPVIAISASRDDMDVQRAEMVGMSAYLYKPVTVSQVSKAYVNSMKSSNMELQKKLTKTSRVANRDPLTGVRSMAAYTDKIDELKAYTQTEMRGFALVECDINGLKHVNDTFGHDIGDVYIVNCCRAICNVFKHSPVYRIGGDEFVVVLQGLDFDRREHLLEDLRNTVNEGLAKPDVIHGKISLAAGIADYDPDKDKTVGDVLKRADISMYNNKKMMHMTLKDA